MFVVSWREEKVKTMTGSTYMSRKQVAGANQAKHRMFIGAHSMN